MCLPTYCLSTGPRMVRDPSLFHSLMDSQTSTWHTAGATTDVCWMNECGPHSRWPWVMGNINYTAQCLTPTPGWAEEELINNLIDLYLKFRKTVSVDIDSISQTEQDINFQSVSNSIYLRAKSEISGFAATCPSVNCIFKTAPERTRESCIPPSHSRSSELPPQFWACASVQPGSEQSTQGSSGTRTSQTQRCTHPPGLMRTIPATLWSSPWSSGMKTLCSWN